jgi:hypothetical protein
MNKPIPTGNELFDLFWEAYPFRNAKKIGKKKCLAKFVLKKYTPEIVQLMTDWIKQDIDNREAVRSKSQFYADPCDAIVFLNNERWEDPIGVVINKTVHRETHRSKAVYASNVKSLIEQWQNVVKEWPVTQLKEHKGFMSAAMAYPEFRKWAIEMRPELKSNKY